MNRSCHLFQDDNQCDPNAATLTMTNPKPQVPPPMVLQKPLPNQGMVANQPLVPKNNVTTSAGQPIDPSVHHLMTLSYDVNLQT